MRLTYASITASGVDENGNLNEFDCCLSSKKKKKKKRRLLIACLLCLNIKETNIFSCSHSPDQEKDRDKVTRQHASILPSCFRSKNLRVVIFLNLMLGIKAYILRSLPQGRLAAWSKYSTITSSILDTFDFHVPFWNLNQRQASGICLVTLFFYRLRLEITT